MKKLKFKTRTSDRGNKDTVLSDKIELNIWKPSWIQRILYFLNIKKDPRFNCKKINWYEFDEIGHRYQGDSFTRWNIIKEAMNNVESKTPTEGYLVYDELSVCDEAGRTIEKQVLERWMKVEQNLLGPNPWKRLRL